MGASVDAWVATAHADPLLTRGWRRNVADRWFNTFVLPVRSRAEVEGRLLSASSDLARMHPRPWRDRRLQTSDATVLAGSPRAGVAMLASILGALALLIVVTAASNVGGVLLARAAATRGHIAIHLSIGSGRAAVMRRQLIEGRFSA